MILTRRKTSLLLSSPKPHHTGTLVRRTVGERPAHSIQPHGGIFSGRLCFYCHRPEVPSDVHGRKQAGMFPSGRPEPVVTVWAQV